MKKANKFVLLVALIFSLFIIGGEVKADQKGPCGNGDCSVTLLEVDPETKNNLSSIIDTDLLNFDGNYDMYYVGFSADNGTRSIEANEKFNFVLDGFADEILGYIPLTSIGGEVRTFKKDSKYYISHELGSEALAEEGYDVNTGLLIVTENFEGYCSRYFADIEFNYGESYSSSMTMENIIHSSTNEIYDISADILFGDFRFNYVVDSNLDGSWAPVNNNSDRLIVDNSKSSSGLDCHLNWYSDNYSQISLEVSHEYFEKGIHQGISIPRVLDGTGGDYLIEAGDKFAFWVRPSGGNMTIAEEIQKNGGQIGYLSLHISASEPDQ